jgi:hypothetical protein
MNRMSLMAIILGVLSLTIFMVNIVNATVFDFESGSYVYYADPSCVAEKSTEQVYAGSNSGKLALDDTDHYAKISMPFNSQLGDASVTFQAYISSISSEPSTLAPYVMFAIDANGNNIYDLHDASSGDAIVIAFITGGSGYSVNTWFQTGLDANTTVHVVGNRTGLTDGTYSASGTQDTLGNLSALTFSGSTTWGDLNVLEVRIGAGMWPSDGTVPYTAYVDNINVVATPIPASALLLGSGLMGLGLLGWRRKRS